MGSSRSNGTHGKKMQLDQCAGYIPLHFIEHLGSGTEILPRKTLLCNNLIERMQYVWANGIISRILKP